MNVEPLKIYLLRPDDSAEALIVVAENEIMAQSLATFGTARYPNAMPIGIATSGIHAGILVQGRLHVEPRG